MSLASKLPFRKLPSAESILLLQKGTNFLKAMGLEMAKVFLVLHGITH